MMGLEEPTLNSGGSGASVPGLGVYGAIVESGKIMKFYPTGTV
jgi:hypothetical protein